MIERALLPRLTIGFVLLLPPPLALSQGAAAHASPAAAPGTVPARIVFPVVGPASYSDDFGDPRAQGGHQANDILAARRAPVVAAESGSVRIWTRSASAGCMLYLHGMSGTTYLYVHLNNDLGPGNDNRGRCAPGVAYAPGLQDGQSVQAGELIGYVGDSGDADGKHPHLHFELHPGDGDAVSPYRWLRRGRPLLFPAPPASQPAVASVVLRGTVQAPPRPGQHQLRMQVRMVALSNGWRFRVDRPLTLTVPAGVTIEGETGSGVGDRAPGRAAAGGSVAVWASVAAPLLDAQAGEPGALLPTRILLAPTG